MKKQKKKMKISWNTQNKKGDNMGLMDKLRDMFTEEVEEPFTEEEPIKKEVIQVEIPAPKKKEEPEELEEEIKEKPVKKMDKPAPIFFDDTDFVGLDAPKPKPKPKASSFYEKPKKEEKVESKKFKPTPIISPVYGVLDKNYHKEDIKSKNNTGNSTYHNDKEVNIDNIRKKAYGTLEDELEITLFGEPEKVEEKEQDIDMFDELLEEPKEERKNIDDSDLFNLIDSMYEKEDDKNGDS